MCGAAPCRAARCARCAVPCRAPRPACAPRPHAPPAPAHPPLPTYAPPLAPTQPPITLQKVFCTPDLELVTTACRFTLPGRAAAFGGKGGGLLVAGGDDGILKLVSVRDSKVGGGAVGRPRGRPPRPGRGRACRAASRAAARAPPIPPAPSQPPQPPPTTTAPDPAADQDRGVRPQRRARPRGRVRRGRLRRRRRRRVGRRERRPGDAEDPGRQGGGRFWRRGGGGGSGSSRSSGSGWRAGAQLACSLLRCCSRRRPLPPLPYAPQVDPASTRRSQVAWSPDGGALLAVAGRDQDVVLLERLSWWAGGAQWRAKGRPG
jgi:hypothetical protein